MAATNISGADRLPEGDYSVAHRSPPPIPPTSPRLASATSPPLREKGSQDRVSVSASEHKRRGSFGVGSFLRRTASGKHSYKEGGNNDQAVPPLPTTRITQVAAVHQEAAEGRKSTSSSRKVSAEGGRSMLRKTSKAQKAQREAERQAEREAYLNRPPPKLNPLADIGSAPFGSDGDPRPDSVAIFNNQYSSSPPTNPRPTNNFSRPGAMASSSPAYAVRGGSAYAGSSPNNVGVGRVNGSKEYVGERTESMTHRGRYSYASSMAPVNVSSPRRVRRRKDPTPFNVLVVGAKNSGKSSLISFLRHSLALPSSKQAANASPPETSTYSASKSSFTSHYLETEMDGERVGLTLWDSAGLEKNIVDLQLREMATFVESKFEETFLEEQKVMRSPGVKDTHIHCVFLILDPVRLDANILAGQKGGDGLDKLAGLDDELDLQVLRVLWGKTTVIPVVSKADTLTMGHMAFLKRAVWQSIKGAKLDPLEALELEDDMAEEDEEDDHSDSDPNNDASVIDNLASDSSSTSTTSADPKPKKKAAHKRHSSLSVVAATTPADDETPYIPMSILSPDPYDLPPYAPAPKNPTSEQVGRRFPWGFASPYDPTHCDFTRLRDSVFSEWRQELRDLSRSKWYENWRTSRLRNVPGSRQRVRGGVTPVASVPREGRVSPLDRRLGSGGSGAVPRSVSGGVTNGDVVPFESRGGGQAGPGSAVA